MHEAVTQIQKLYNIVVLRVTLTVLIVCGLLDATAVANISNFGIGIYVAADILALGILAIHANRVGWSQITIKLDILGYAAIFIALIWCVAALQTWFEMIDTWRLLTQTTLRTLLIVHFLICTVFVYLVNDRKFLVQVATVFLVLYLTYGIYDFIAQVFGYPRFLDALRNSHSFNINQGVGLQGWILLPRLSSLAAEPSHTALHVLLAIFLATKLEKRSRGVGLMILALTFCIGTFARTIWIALAGATVASAIVSSVSRRNEQGRAVGEVLVRGLIALLPIAVLLLPLLPSLSADADASVLERFDSSRAGIYLFVQHPLLGMGLHGWDSHPVHYLVDRLAGSPGNLRDVLNGVAVYLAALGVAGLVVVYVPLILLFRSDMGVVARSWWVCAYSLTLLGGDYLALASTWTAIAIVAAPGQLRPHSDTGGVGVSGTQERPS